MSKNKKIADPYDSNGANGALRKSALLKLLLNQWRRSYSTMSCLLIFCFLQSIKMTCPYLLDWIPEELSEEGSPASCGLALKGSHFTEARWRMLTSALIRAHQWHSCKLTVLSVEQAPAWQRNMLLLSCLFALKGLIQNPAETRGKSPMVQ